MTTQSIPAALYIRVSSDQQIQSLEYQRSTLETYALANGFGVVRVYVDQGKSGLTVRSRGGLKELLHCVLSGEAPFTAILVYDVSRWGRFQDIDEAAHYEFLCRAAGVEVHYCAEPSVGRTQEGAPILKALKRVMAGEYSRELGAKCFAGQKRSAQLGFMMGCPPFGYRRMLVSSDGSHKRLLAPHESKSFASDRVILVPGPSQEVECVQKIFELALQGMPRTAIRQHIYESGYRRSDSRPIEYQTIWDVLQNPVYIGTSAWNRRSQKLGGPRRNNPREEWIIKTRAFQPLIDNSTFERVQSLLRRKHMADDEILLKLKNVLKESGRITRKTIRKGNEAGLCPSPTTYCKRFGSIEHAIELIGKKQDPDVARMRKRAKEVMHMRDALIQRLLALFPEHLSTFTLPGKQRLNFRVDNEFEVSVRVLTKHTTESNPGWLLVDIPHENRFVTLLALLNPDNSEVESYLVCRGLNNHAPVRFHLQHRSAFGAKRLRRLEEFYEAAKQMRDLREAETCNP
jgi:DNA invertase Pin-like site-specific DNA recombinase